jgi:two-component system, LytTR family, sensor kinase
MQPDGMRTSRVIALALLAGSFFTAQEVFMDLAQGRGAEVTVDISNGATVWAAWAVLTPAVLVVLRRWPLDRRPVAYPLLAHVTIGLALSVLHNLMTTALFRLELLLRGQMNIREALTSSPNPVGFVSGLFTGLLYYWLVVGVYTALRYRRSAEVLQAELTQSKLDTLRAQLRPHFLFNTLNAISVFTVKDQAKAQQMLLRLSSLLRRSLDEEAHQVSLRRELAFLNDYLDIQRGRFGDQLAVGVEADAAALDASVPVFVLQPLLENAIEHGKSEGKCNTIAVRAIRDADMLHVTIDDDGPGISNSASARDGVGLGNTRARLHHLYGTRATVALAAVHPGALFPGTRVEIRIPYRVMSD